jgi:Tfp pilus assembly pilus retraction ATPase PilT
MVGEIRDTETAQMVTHAALTGHLVFLLYSQMKLLLLYPD